MHKCIDGIESKMCACCKIYKPLNQYGIDKHRLDKLNPYCNVCKKHKSSLFKNKNRELVRESARNRYYNNRERLLTQSNEYHYKKRCGECGGEKEYLKIKNKFKNKINEGLTFQVLKKLLPNIDIKHNKHKIYTPDLSSRNFIKPDFYFVIDNRKIIVEYNGQQHYEVDTHFFKEKAQSRYNDQIIRDKYLRNYCKDNNIILIEIDGREYIGYIKIFNYMKEKLINSFKCDR